ncbi:MAG TPA: hypothetical protein VLZ89_18260 [Anaerolineales bacterium]|nr:hypothetical protein [Anaerolineales bacterium]
MEYSFVHYLQSKQTVDDRALNRDVLAALKANLPPAPCSLIEIGAGIGTMATRLIEWGLLTDADYLALDEMEENIAYAAEWIPRWAASAGLGAERMGADKIRLHDQARDVRITLACADVFDFINTNPPRSDLLIAHAVLDLFPLPESLPKLFSLTKALAWLTVNFDGVTAFEPAIDPALDETIERLYHRSMDTRPTGGDSRTGRHLFSHLQAVGAQILAAGASDWVVHPLAGRYPAEEKYFLYCILHFFEESLTGSEDLDPRALADWLSKRRAQIEGEELVYIAHQMDFLVKP